MTETVQHTECCVEARRASDEAWRAYVEPERASVEAWRASDEARRAYVEAERAYVEAWRECGCDG